MARARLAQSDKGKTRDGAESSRWSSLIGLSAAACVACHWTPPVAPPDPAEQDEKLVQPGVHATATGVDFTPPRADSVRATRSGTPPAQPLAGRATDDDHSPVASATARIGHVLLTMGPRPPYAQLPEELSRHLQQPTPAPTTHAESASTQVQAPSRHWTLQRTLHVGEGYLYQAEFTPDGSEVLTLSSDSGTLYRFDVNSGRRISTWPLPNASQYDVASFAVLRGITEHPQILLARPSGISVLDLESGHQDPLEFVPNGDTIAHSGRNGLYGVTARQVEPQSGRLHLIWADGVSAASLECEQRPDDWSLSEDGSLLALAFYPENSVQLFNLREQSLMRTFESPKWGGSVALSPDKSLLALGGEKLVVYRLPSGKLIDEDARYGNNIADIRFAPDGGLLLVSAFDGKARSYDLGPAPSELTALPRPQVLAHAGTANVYGLGLTQDGRKLVTSSGDQTIKLWSR